MKKILLLPSLLFLSLVLALLSPFSASAAFNQNNIMADNVFSNSSTMNAGQIDAFLNSFPSSCISTNRGFSSPNVTGYNPSQGFLYGSNVSAGTVIANASQAYDLNPQVILATLQKEQSLVSGSAGCYYDTPATQTPCPDPPYGGDPNNGCVTACQHAGGCVYVALGYDCPYYCVPNSTGFSKQIIKAAWKLKFVQERSVGNYNWNLQKPGWDNSDDPLTSYDGYMTQGNLKRNSSSSTVFYDGYRPVNSNSLTVHLGSGATASLYSYTPFTSGNTNFVNIFEGWFGSTQSNVPFAWSYEGQWAYVDSGRTQQFTSIPTTTPGGKIYVTFKARNMGNQTWSQSNFRVGTSRPQDRNSTMTDPTWIGNNRPVALAESSVAPGQIGTFNFVLQAPISPGTYGEYFNLLVEGQTWLNDLGLYFTVNVNDAASADANNRAILNSGETLNKHEYLLSPDSQTVLVLQGDGNLVQYTNFKSPWNTGPFGTGVARLTLQADGNLVMYNSTGQALWNTQTQGNPGARLVLQTDGNIVLYSATNSPLWATYGVHTPNNLSYINTRMNVHGFLFPGQSIETADRRYKLIMQTDGNLVLYSPSRALWASGTNGTSVRYLAMQGDGNLVLYGSNSQPIWYSNTAGHGSNLQLVIQQDGNLVLYNPQGRPFWHTATAGQQ